MDNGGVRGKIILEAVSNIPKTLGAIPTTYGSELTKAGQTYDMTGE